MRFDASENACRTVDFNSIDIDIYNSLKYAREAEHAIHDPDPPLRQRSGVYISDDLVPASLHHEVSLLGRAHWYSRLDPIFPAAGDRT